MSSFLVCFLLFIFIIILSILITYKDYREKQNKNTESFNVRFSDYKVPNPGYCKAPITKKDFAGGKYDTYCWSNMGDEDCGLVNNNGYNCGKNLVSNQILPCVYKYGEWKDDASCFSTAYDRVGKFKEPYMIQVDADNLIGLGPI